MTAQPSVPARAHRTCVPRTRQFLTGVAKERRDNFTSFAGLFALRICPVGVAIREVELWWSDPEEGLGSAADVLGGSMSADNAQHVPALPSVVKLVCELRHGSLSSDCLRHLRRILPNVADIRAKYSWIAIDGVIDFSDILNDWHFLLCSVLTGASSSP